MVQCNTSSRCRPSTNSISSERQALGTFSEITPHMDGPALHMCLLTGTRSGARLTAAFRNLHRLTNVKGTMKGSYESTIVKGRGRLPKKSGCTASTSIVWRGESEHLLGNSFLIMSETLAACCCCCCCFPGEKGVGTSPTYTCHWLAFHCTLAAASRSRAIKTFELPLLFHSQRQICASDFEARVNSLARMSLIANSKPSSVHVD